MLKKWIATLFLLSTSLYANEDGASVYLESLKKDNPKLSAALSIDGVNQIYNTCFNGISSANNGVIGGSELMNCVWKGNSAYGVPDGQGVIADDKLKQQVIDAMNDNKKYRSVASESATTVDKSGEIASNRYEEKAKLPAKKKSKALLAYEEHLKKQLEEALYGEKKPANKDELIKTERIVDQKTFFELFESQVGKNVITSLSNFCISAKQLENNSDFFVIYKKEEDRVKVYNENLKILEDAKTENNTLSAASQWNTCIGKVQDHCHQPDKKLIKDESGKFSEVEVNFLDKFKNTCKVDQNDEICSKDDIEYTQQRACETIEYISQARRSLEYNQKVMEKFSKLETKGTPTNVSVYSSGDAKKNIDEITTITSNSLNGKNEATNAVKVSNEEAEAFKECFEAGELKDAKKCEEYLQKNRDERLASLTEMKINSEASIKELDEQLNDKEQIVKILRQDGYEEKEAIEMAKQENIKELIIKRYRKKEEAILRSAVEEMEKITSKKNDTIDDGDKTTLAIIEKNLKNKTKEFAQLVHFNNIVIGYLDINGKDKDGNQTKKKNTRSIQLELENNIFKEENRKIASENNNSFANTRITAEDYQEKLKQTGYDPEDSSEEDAQDVKLSPTDIVKALIGIVKYPDKK